MGCPTTQKTDQKMTLPRKGLSKRLSIPLEKGRGSGEQRMGELSSSQRIELKKIRSLKKCEVMMSWWSVSYCHVKRIL